MSISLPTLFLLIPYATAQVSPEEPLAEELRIEPAEPTATDVLICVGLGAQEAETSWTVDGQPQEAEGPRLEPGSFAKGQEVSCTAVVGEEAFTATARILNTPPFVEGAAIEPTLPTSADDLRCVSGQVSDVDGDDVELRVSWEVDEVALDVDGSTLEAARTARGQVVRCSIEAWDGEEAWDLLTSDPVEVGNALPVVGGVSLVPERPTASDPLRCVADGVVDADGDEVELEIAWTVDGAEVEGDEGLSAGVATRGQRVGCVVTPSDGEGAGQGASAEVVLVGTAPVVDGVEILPAEPLTTQALRCEAEVSDADGDEVELAWAWTVDGEAEEAQGPSLSPEHTSRGRRIGCVVTASDDELDGEPAAAVEVVVGNSPPVVELVRVEPEQPRTDTPLACVAEGVRDDDGDEVALTTAWTVDDEPAGGDSDRLDPSATAKGQVVACAVTPRDGIVAGELVASAGVEVLDTPPTVGGARILPETPTVGDELRCEAGELDDADGEEVEARVTWTVDGEQVEGLGQLSKGQRVGCSLVPVAAGSEGQAVAAEGVVVLNSPPTVGRARVAPESPRTSQTLSCEVEDLADPDGDEVLTSIHWVVDDERIDAEQLDPRHHGRGQRVHCVITPTDGEVEGAALRSESVVIGNTPPRVGSARIEPGQPAADEALSCLADDIVDDDGDPVSLSWQWTADGVALSAVGEALQPGPYAKDQQIGCAVTPSDGMDEGASVSAAPVVVRNSPPVIEAVVVRPDPAITTDELRCETSGVTDVDGDEVHLHATWTIDGAPAGVEGDRLASDRFRRGQEVSCAVTASDGDLEGESLTAAPTTVSNAPPVVRSLTVWPAEVRRTGPITADVLTGDPDGDPVELSWQWRVNGRSVGEGESLEVEHFHRGDRVELLVTPHDGFEAGEIARSGELQVYNALPPAPVVVVGDSVGGTLDMVCHLLGDVVDADGDSLRYQVSWEVDGAAFTGARTTRQPGDTVPASAIEPEQQWTCTVRAHDGIAAGASGRQTVWIIEPRVSAGSGHTCALGTRGNLRCWGIGDYNATMPPQGEFRRVVSGAWHNCALDLDGHLQCWGHDRYGQATPPAGRFVEISAGGWHSCALDSQGGLMCWGQDEHGQTQAPPGTYRQVSAGWQHTCALTEAGELVCWGNDENGEASPPGGRFTQVAAGQKHSCALAEDGSLACWGDDRAYQATPPPGEYLAVSAGENHSCALDTDRRVVCWGLDNFGQTTEPEGAFRRLGKGTTHQCAVDVAGRIHCWGRNNYGQTEVP